MASAPAEASTPVVTVLLNGDDIVMGITSNSTFPTITTSRESDQAQASLQNQFQDTGIAIVNKASGGTASTLPDMLAGVDGGGPPFANRLIGSTARFVIDAHSLNEIYESVDAYTAALAQWRQTVLNAGMVPILEEPNPTCDPNEINMPPYVQAMDSFAAANNVPLITQYAAVQAIPDWQSHMTQCRYPDAYLITFKAQREAAALAALIKPTLGE